MFNVTDGRDRNVGVDFLFSFFDFYLQSLDSPNIFNYIYVSHINMLNYQTPGSQNKLKFP